MSKHDIIELVRMILVIALVIAAAALATPKGRLPLALRGLMKIMRKDTGREVTARTDGVPTWKRLIAFVLVILAFFLAMFIV